MKILYISDIKSIHTQKWATYFSNYGYEVHVVSFNEIKLSNVHVYKLNNFGIGKLGYLFALYQLKKIAKKIDPDIIHAQHLTSYGFLASLIKFKPLIVTAWGTDLLITPEKSLFFRLLLKYVLRKADIITTVAEHMNKIVFKYNKKAKNVITIPFGIDLDIFAFYEHQKRENNVIRIISTRNFEKVYSIDTFIYAISILNKKNLSIKVDLVGDGSLKKELINLVNELSLDKIIKFHGYLTQKDLVKLLHNSDIFISSSLSDGNNVSLTEAMACGCFPIATDIPANIQWIEDNRNGLLFEKNNFENLSEKIIMAINLKNKKIIIKKNRYLIEKKANWEYSTKLMAEKYKELISMDKNNVKKF